MQVILLLQRRLSVKKMITVKFNNPSFHPSQPSTEPVCIQRQTAPGSTVDLTLPAQVTLVHTPEFQHCFAGNGEMMCSVGITQPNVLNIY